MKYCPDCQDYYPQTIYPAHMKQHQVGNPAVEHKQFGGVPRDESDYMICILHQKKTPCPVKGCTLTPFGCTRKSYMILNAKQGFFQTTNNATGKQEQLPIDLDTKIVMIMGVPIHLKI